MRGYKFEGEKKMKKEDSGEWNMIWMTIIIFGIVCILLNVKITNLESSLLTQGYYEVCHKSHIENKQEFIPAKINSDCIFNRTHYKICIPPCTDHFREWEYSNCKDRCGVIWDECMDQIEVNQPCKDKDEYESAYVFAECLGCIEPSYIKNTSIEICDETILVSKDKYILEGEK